MKWIKNNKGGDDTLKPGMVFEKYTVVKLLGQGGMGSVYLVRHNVLDSLFALKILASDVAAKNKQFVDRFIREAKLACKIRHPNLIAVHDAGQNPKNGLYYIVMDYVSGGSVRDLLKKTHRIPPDQALTIITQVADALTAACAHHMVHRDIKPDNIMFAADGSVKLADLGIAKSTDEQDTMITMASSVFGTPAYMSPEQAKDSSKVDSRADIYSLGIVFFEMLTGQRPFSGNTAIQILSQVMDSSAIPDIRQICPDAPPDLALLIARMSEKTLEKRIQTPDILLQELKKIHIPSQLQARVLRTREEIPAGGSVPAAPDVTMPTMQTVGDVLATPPAMPSETPPASSAASEAPSSPVTPVESPAKVSAASEAAPAVSAPDVTIPTVANVPTAAPAAEPTHISTPTDISAPAPTPAPAAPAPDVTMPTMQTVANVPTAAPAATPAPTPAPAAPATRPPVSGTTPAAEKKASAPAAEKASSPAATAQPKKNKKGILVIILIAAACLILVPVALLAVILIFGSEEPAPAPGPNPGTEPAHTVVSGQDTPSNVTVIPDTPAITHPQQPAGGSTDISGSAAQPAQAGTATPETMTPDPLGKNQIVLLSDTSAVSARAKSILSGAFGAENVSFQEAEGMGSYKQLLKTIIKSNPTIVVLCFAQQYEEDGISASGYGNVIGYHADQFLENGIPFMFIQPAGDDSARMRAFREATTDLCRQRSIPFIDADELTEGNLVPVVRENKKSE